MIRLPIFASLLLSLASAVQAAQPPRYAVTAQATRADNKITVLLKFAEHNMQVVPSLGLTDVITELSTRIMLNEGQRAELAGDGPHDATQPAGSGDLNGHKIDVISVKGRDTVLVVSTIVEGGMIVWADATTVPITAASK